MEWTGTKKLLITVWRKVRISDVEKIDSSAVMSCRHTDLFFVHNYGGAAPIFQRAVKMPLLALGRSSFSLFL